MIPIVEPDGIFRLISESANFRVFIEYLNETLSNSILPSFTSVRPFSGDLRLLSCSMTSAIRLADSVAIDVMTNTIVRIIIALKICTP